MRGKEREDAGERVKDRRREHESEEEREKMVEEPFLSSGISRANNNGPMVGQEVWG